MSYTVDKAWIAIRFDPQVPADAGYREIEIALPSGKKSRFATGNVIEDWNNAIDAIILSDAYALDTDPSVKDFMDQPSCPMELYTGRARVGHPFSIASYMRRKTVPVPLPAPEPEPEDDNLLVGRD